MSAWLSLVGADEDTTLGVRVPGKQCGSPHPRVSRGDREWHAQQAGSQLGTLA